MKKALITGITGQDGSYLAELLIEKGYEVHGLVRRTSTFNRNRIEHLYKKDIPLYLHYGDMTDQSSIMYIMQKVEPDEVYNLAAQSHVKVSFDEPEYTANSDALGALRILEVIRSGGLSKKTRFYQASTSEMYGGVQSSAQGEATPFIPQSPYAAAKLYAFWLTTLYRKAYGMFACNGILFNHESPRRGESFVTRKITIGIARIMNGMQDYITLGNLDSKRDWGYAPEYVQAMWLMLQQDEPDDFVIATGQTHTVREFVQEAFAVCGVEIGWRGKAETEVGYDVKSGAVRVKISPEYYRPAEVSFLLGDNAKAREKLTWSPKVAFKDLVRIMVEHDMRSVSGTKDNYSFYV